MTDELRFIAIDEARVASADGDMVDAYVRLEVDPATMEAIRPFVGQRVELALRAVENDGARSGPVIVAQDRQLGPYCEYLAACFDRGVFSKNVDVLRALGSDNEYQSYCRQLPCEISGEFEDSLHGEPRSVFAHVSDAGRPTSGKQGQGSNKPIFSGVPMCQSLHQLQHNQGWIAVLNYYCRLRGYDREARAKLDTHFRSALIWARSLRDRRLNQWAVSRLTEILGVCNTGSITPQAILDWANNNHVIEFFPLRLERSILRGSALHQTIEILKSSGVSAQDVGPEIGWSPKSYAVRNVYAGLFVTCQNPGCGREFAPPTPIGRPYSRRFCSAECAAISNAKCGHAHLNVPAEQSQKTNRFLYG